MQGVKGAGIQPGCAPSQDGDVELVSAQIFLVDIGDFVFAAGGWL
ncbi:MAG: hypothetical protein UZ08_BCD001001214 [Candidatus Parvibacillus calidus]|nr:MAG: hypothetical protein UZ08_BCD001001214 [Candidatus Parvibacillus calidus]